ncbi:acyltransferase family protein [Vulcanococcus limneticus]|uniref:acyltransferase family protein n=1 Tax=Vulcanococcus limneticus TaxID=2170428 RepID=UPI0020CCDA56|nr:acyltransferase [Vulcanococcus limneticus]
MRAPSADRSEELGRIRAIDDLRSAVIILVVAHHAALAYIPHAQRDPLDYMRSTAPVVDPLRWWPLDLLVSWNDQFFMALLFLLSGLFVIPAIRRKGIGGFVRERVQRLGLPFLLAAGLLSPLAFYPSWLQGPRPPGPAYWQRYFVLDGWSPGPAWFLWLLLAYSLLLALACALAPPRLRRWGWRPRSAKELLLTCLLASGLASGVMAVGVGAETWFTLTGPFSAQTSRLLLYGAWFLVGVALGAGDLEQSLALERLRPWRLWALLGLLAYLLTLVQQAQPAGLAPLPPLPLRLGLALSSAAGGTFTILAALGWARHHLGAPSRLADSLSRHSYAIFLLHYPLVTWIQFALLGSPLPAPLKFLLSFSGALSGSWLLAIALRRTPARQVI